MISSTISENYPLKNMNTLLETKLDLFPFVPTKIKLNCEPVLKFPIISPPKSDLKVDKILNSYTVYYYLQPYFFNELTNKFEIFDKSYKNILKDKLISIKKDDKEKQLIKSCILSMTEGEQSIFEIESKNLLPPEIFENKKKIFIERKRKEKERELKAIAKDKIVKEINEERERRKKNGETNIKIERKEIVIDENLIKEIDNQYKFEEKIYYRIYIEEVLKEKPSFPKNANYLEKHIKFYNDEIRRLILKKDLVNAESWSNEIKGQIINMEKGKVKNDYESKRFEEKKVGVENEMKKALLNLSYIYQKKINNTSTNIANIPLINQAIDLVENVYYPRYKNDFDKSYLKISGRLIQFYLLKKEFGIADKIINIVERNCKNLEDADKNTIINDFREDLAKKENKEKKNLVKKNKIKIEMINKENNDNEVEYDWEVGLTEEEVKEILDRKSKEIAKTLALVNKSLSIVKYN